MADSKKARRESAQEAFSYQLVDIKTGSALVILDLQDEELEPACIGRNLIESPTKEQAAFLSRKHCLVGINTLSSLCSSNEIQQSTLISYPLRCIKVTLDRTTRRLDIQDLGGINGTYVNGVRVRNANLRNGDVIRVGGLQSYRLGERYTKFPKWSWKLRVVCDGKEPIPVNGNRQLLSDSSSVEVQHSASTADAISRDSDSTLTSPPRMVSSKNVPHPETTRAVPKKIMPDILIKVTGSRVVEIDDSLEFEAKRGRDEDMNDIDVKEHSTAKRELNQQDLANDLEVEKPAENTYDFEEPETQVMDYIIEEDGDNVDEPEQGKYQCSRCGVYHNGVEAGEPYGRYMEKFCVNCYLPADDLSEAEEEVESASVGKSKEEQQRRDKNEVTQQEIIEEADENEHRQENSSSTFMDTEADAVIGDGMENEVEEKYCFCRQAEFGEMICCENDNCAIKWFHFQCVGLTNVPDMWFCPECSSSSSSSIGGKRAACYTDGITSKKARQTTAIAGKDENNKNLDVIVIDEAKKNLPYAKSSTMLAAEDDEDDVQMIATSGGMLCDFPHSREHCTLKLWTNPSTASAYTTHTNQDACPNCYW